MRLAGLVLLIVFLSGCISGTVTKTRPTDGLEIVGGEEFVQATENALNLLRVSPEYQDIVGGIGRIREADRSGMDVYEDVPTFEVAYRSWNHSSIWYAGIIAHDSCHSRLYFTAKAEKHAEPSADVWTGKYAEQKCLDYQIRVLSDLGADKGTMEYLRGLRVNPTYQDVGYGSRDW